MPDARFSPRLASAACVIFRRSAGWFQQDRALEPPAQLILPLFARPGKKASASRSAPCPGQAQLSIDNIAEEARDAAKLGLGGIILFGIPAEKDPLGRDSYSDSGIVQQAVKAAKDAAPDLLVITDVCLLRIHRPRPLRRDR